MTVIEEHLVALEGIPREKVLDMDTKKYARVSEESEESSSHFDQALKGDRYLVVSPYLEQDHLLDLETLDAENKLLALALTRLKCLRNDYATAPYIESFNWDEIIDTLRALAHEVDHRWKETSFFVVAFRSRIPPTTVYADLGVLDKAAHAEATASGGFLKYGLTIGP